MVFCVLFVYKKFYFKWLKHLEMFWEIQVAPKTSIISDMLWCVLLCVPKGICGKM